jgi:hypothetical protein
MRILLKAAIAPVAAAILCAPVFCSAAEATSPTPVPNAAAQEAAPVLKPAYTSCDATVKEINGTSVLASTENGDYVFHLSAAPIFSQKSQSLISVEAIKKDDRLMVFYPVNTPMNLSLPPQLGPSAVVLADAKDGLPFVKADVFNNGRSSDLLLLIPKEIDEGTAVVDAKGSPADASRLDGAELLVFYAKTNRMLPPTATPDKIVVIKYAEDAARLAYASREAVVIEAEGASVLANIASASYRLNLESARIFSQKTRAAVSVKDIKKGDSLLVCYPSGTPVLLSEPAQFSPSAVIIKDAGTASFVKADVFTDGSSSDGSLLIPGTLDAQTPVVDINGEPADAARLNGAALLVFYSKADRMLPPTAAPDKIVVLEYAPAVSESELEGRMPQVTPDETAHFERDGVVYAQLRAAAEPIGFKVQWDGATKTATLTRGDASYSVTVGKTDYVFNGKTSEFPLSNPPFIQDGRLYVESEFLQNFV